MQGQIGNGDLCGAKSNPCNDLNFAVEISEENDTILLLQNGSNENFTNHQINETIRISKGNLTIKSVTGKYTFTPSDAKQHEEFALLLVKGNSSRITFQGISIFNMTVLNIDKSNTSVHFVECDLKLMENSLVNFERNTSNNISATYWTTLEIINSTIDTDNYIIHHNEINWKVHMVVRDSLITSGAVYSSGGLHLTLNNVIFEGAQDRSYGINDGFIKVKRGKIVLNNVTVTGYYKSHTFLSCEFCKINGTLVRFIGLIIRHGFKLISSSAEIDLFDIYNIGTYRDLIVASYCSLTIHQFHADYISASFVFNLSNTVTKIREIKIG